MAAKDAEGEDINIKELQGEQDKIRDLMRRDPKFIGRLIVVSERVLPCASSQPYKLSKECSLDTTASVSSLC